MGNIEFYYEDQWKLTDLDSITTEHPNFPSENTQHRDKHREWRSKYGSGSGWGYFYIGTSNNKLYFKDTTATARTATIATGAYNADSLATEIATKMTSASPPDTFVAEYLESGTYANRFQITDQTGVFELTCTSTTNAIWDTIGFATAADATGSSVYISNDGIRIHTVEYIRQDLGAGANIYGFFVIGHNLQSTATAHVRASSTTFGTWDIDVALDDITTQVAYKRWTSAQNYRYWEYFYIDKKNPDTFVKNGTLFLCTQPFTPVRGFSESPSYQNIDPSLLKMSEDGGVTSSQFSHYKAKNYSFITSTSSELANFNSMFDDVGTSKPLVIIEDTNNLPDSIYYARLTSMDMSALQYSTDYWEIRVGAEEIR